MVLDRILRELAYLIYVSFQVAVLQGNLPAVHDLWKDCTRYYSPSIINLRKFVKAFSTLGDLQSAYHILQRMVVLAGERTDHLRVSSKRRWQSTRLDIPVPALNEVEDLKIVSGYDLPSSFQGKMGTEEYLVDDQPELLQVETQSSKHKQLKSYASVISAGLLCIPISSAKYTCRPIFKFLELIYLQSSSR
jgi:hypothetical protein